MFFCKEMRSNRENAVADKDRFSDARTDSVGFSQINRSSLEKPTLSADNVVRHYHIIQSDII